MNGFVLIGQAPGKRGLTKDGPLAGAVGRRIARLIGISEERYLSKVLRENVLDRFPGGGKNGDAFPAEAARLGAARLLAKYHGRRFVLLGRKTARAFGIGEVPWFEWREHGAVVIAVAPHPSGLCRFWNDPRAVQEARTFFISLLSLSVA